MDQRQPAGLPQDDDQQPLEEAAVVEHDEELVVAEEEPELGGVGDLDDAAFAEAAEAAVDLEAAAVGAGVAADVLIAAPPEPFAMAAAPGAGAAVPAAAGAGQQVAAGAAQPAAAAVPAAAAAAPAAAAAGLAAGIPPDQVALMLRAVGDGKRRLKAFESGEGHEWQIWRRSAETTVTMCGWNNCRARREIFTAMEGSAAAWVADIPVNDHLLPAPPAVPGLPAPAADAADYRLLLNEYEARFLPPAAADVLRVAFRAAKAREGETLLAWHSRLRNLYARAYPHLDAAALQVSPDLRDQFILGIWDAKTRELAWSRRPATYAAALAEASNAQAGEHILKGRGDFDPFAVVKKELHHMGSYEEYSDDDEGIHAARRSRAAPQSCWNCGKTGHIARECRPHRGRMDRPRSRDGARGRRGPIGRAWDGDEPRGGKRRTSGGRGGRNPRGGANRTAGRGGRGGPGRGGRSGRGRGRLRAASKRIAHLESADGTEGDDHYEEGDYHDGDYGAGN